MERSREKANVARLLDAVLGDDGESPAEERRAAFAAAATCSGLDVETAPLANGVADLVHRVATQAYRVTDEDYERLRRAGRSEDELFELTVAAALGASVARLEIGLRALRGKNP